MEDVSSLCTLIVLLTEVCRDNDWWALVHAVYLGA